MFAVFALQKLYSVYYYASGRTLASFSLSDTSRDCSYYDLLLAESFSTDHLRIYSEGGTLSRLEKTRVVVDYAPSHKYLNVCTDTATNCSRCEKCTRTLLALDMLGRLDDYRAVFDVDHYRTHKKDYLATLVSKKWEHNVVYEELYPYFRSQLTIGAYWGAILHYAVFRLRRSVPEEGKLRGVLKRIYHSLRKQ